MGQVFEFGMFDCCLAEAAGITTYAMDSDVDAICRAADAGAVLAERLGVPKPVPHLYGFSYLHISTLGAKVVFGPDHAEPSSVPCIHSPEDIDRLREPEDYLKAGVVSQRLDLVKRLSERRPDASRRIGHDYEGPITTAVLLMGQDFFLLAHDDPARAHRLLDFCVRSALNFARVLRAHQGRPFGGQWEGIPDDFAGFFNPEQFKEFVVPYWHKLYEGLGARRRDLHSELLRPEHMPLLEDLKLTNFDPSVDPYLPAEALAAHCRVPYGLRIWPSVVQSRSAEELVAFYRHLASFKSNYVTFHLERLADEPKIVELLKVARELKQQGA